ncbi:MAG: hypothetical protein ACRDJV_15675 [Actinomycetota bacterium]
MARSKTKPIRVLPGKVVPMSEEDFEEVTDLLAEIILERLNRARRARPIDLPEEEDDEVQH